MAEVKTRKWQRLKWQGNCQNNKGAKYIFYSEINPLKTYWITFDNDNRWKLEISTRIGQNEYEQNLIGVFKTSIEAKNHTESLA